MTRAVCDLGLRSSGLVAGSRNVKSLIERATARGGRSRQLRCFLPDYSTNPRIAAEGIRLSWRNK